MTTSAAPSAASSSASTATGSSPALKRTVGFWGLTFVSLGSIIGSGWLLGALTAAKFAGGSALISWVIAAIMLMVLALIHADLGGAYPVAGGTARYPHYAFGGFAGFTAGWVTYLQAVFIAPLEVEASLSYVNSVGNIKNDFPLVNVDGTLTTQGIVVGILAMILFTFINLGGARWLSDSNTGIVIWKTFVPLLTIVVLITLSFHPANFTANGGFAPFGFHGIFAALPAGVVFALQGFEQASQMAGEAKNPKKDVAKAIILAMAIGALLYLLLEVAFIGSLDPATLIQNGWANPIGAGDYGPYYTLALAAGAGWLAAILIIDAVISPGGTGLIYVGTTARISYALGLPNALTRINARGVPIWSLVLASLLGIGALLVPGSGWLQLVGYITSATAIMYAFAPISLAALRKADLKRHHPYKAPAPMFLLPLGFVFANLIIYWGGWDATWRLSVAVLIGQILFVIAALVKAKNINLAKTRWQAALWIWPWLLGMCVLGLLGNFGSTELNILPTDWDTLIVAAFAVVIFYFAVSRRMSADDVVAQVEEDLEHEEEADGQPAVLSA
ncbi:APC family permease [Subtercola endophyticus]|uniref:APC family permease n=1 Tax=Subtercola endophyticus TaxID=2895559 RepID=UPI001E518C9E|nr:APC family permease [Subtercola endophyticus]UFS57474.1 APC family permease [Subtercola endophyticus]